MPSSRVVCYACGDVAANGHVTLSWTTVEPSLRCSYGPIALCPICYHAALDPIAAKRNNQQPTTEGQEHGG